MKGIIVVILAIGLTGGLALAQYDAASQSKAAAKPDFDITASYIEACSCDMFCPCYYNTRSTHHHDGEYCRANLVLRTDKGYYRDTKLDGAKVWVATISEAIGAPARIPGWSFTMTLLLHRRKRPLSTTFLASSTPSNGSMPTWTPQDLHGRWTPRPAKLTP